MHRTSKPAQPIDAAAAAMPHAPPAATSPAWVPCLHCGGSVSARAGICGFCGAPVDSAPGSEALAQLGSRVEQLTGGAFTVDRLLGCGAHGCTFQARDAATGEAVALKFVRLAAGLAANTVARLGETLAAAAAVGHPRILAPSPPETAGNDAVYWTTPLVAGGRGAHELLGAAQPPSFDAIAPMLLDVSAALEAAHVRGVPHLALTPAKLILDRSGRGYVADLGVALGFRGGTSLSGPGGVERAAYAAPEQWGGVADGRADQYALAIITYELVSGKRRAEADSVGSMTLLAPIEVPADAHLQPGVPLSVNVALRRALAKRPEHRFPTIGEFAAAAAGKVDATPESLPTLHPLVDLPPRRRQWMLPTVGALVLLIGAWVMVGQWFEGEGPLARRARESAAGVASEREAEVARAGQSGPGAGRSVGEGGGADADAVRGTVAPTAGPNAANARSFIRVTAGGTRAVVVVDGTPRGVAPLTIRVDPGSHTVTLRGGRLSGASRTVTTAGGATTNVAFDTPATP